MIKYFPNILEYDDKTNQVKVKDEHGLIYVVPVAYFGVVKRISSNTPVIVVMSDTAKPDVDFDKAGKIRIDAVAIPIYNSERFSEGEVSNVPKVVGSVSGGKIDSYVEVGDDIRIHSEDSNRQTLTVSDDVTTLQDVKMINPDISYGDFAAPQPFLLRFRPDFPYLMPELLPSGTIFEKAARFCRAFLKIRST
jgi:hypothetical protein